LRKLPLYTVGTLQLYAGMEDCRVLLDARGKRAYTCRFRDGEALEEEQVLPLEEIRPLAENEKIVGDGHLIGREDVWPDIAENFLALKDAWKKAENVHLVVPDYLKPSEAYLLHK
jgi:tRNA threonylcarbamoyladenosine biosynthesis protein TsaB